MRIAVAAENGSGLEGPTCQHFGHAGHFVLVDCEGGVIQHSKSLPNPFAAEHQPGQIPQFLHEQGVDAVLSGGMGARAIDLFRRWGVDPVTGAQGSVRDSVELFLAGSLAESAPCADSVAHGH